MPYVSPSRLRRRAAAVIHHVAGLPLPAADVADRPEPPAGAPSPSHARGRFVSGW